MKFLTWYTLIMSSWTIIYCIEGMATKGVQDGDILAIGMWLPVVVFPILLLKNKKV